MDNFSFEKRVKCDSPVVEQTPIVWKNKLLLVESWQRHWETPPGSEKDFYIRIRDEGSNSILTRTMNGFGYSSAFVWSDTIYIFASKKEVYENSVHKSHDIFMSCSTDLTNWSNPEKVINGEKDEQLFNQSVCYDGNQFIIAFESLSKQHTSFTIKFAKSTDLKKWEIIPGAIYGHDRYTACPCIRYCNGYYYMLYLEHLKPLWRFETYLTRSRDLVEWENSPYNPVIVPNPEEFVHKNCVHSNSDYDKTCTANGREINTSDPDVVEWNDKTRIYFTGGCQHWGGLLQYVEYNGSMIDFFESYFNKNLDR
ncbi:MAG: hypothetical protein ABFD79_15340 [Phycisphaerales bacterium]